MACRFQLWNHVLDGLTCRSHSTGISAWKCLIDRRLTSDERVSLIRDIFSDHNDTTAVVRLRGDDAQSFVDVIDKVLFRPFIPGYPLVKGQILPLF